MKPITAIITITSQGEGTENNAISYGLSARWQTAGGVSAGDADTGSGGTLRIPVTPGTDRRRCFAISTSAATLKRNIDAGFAWTGGTPTVLIDLEDFPTTPPASLAQTHGVKVNGLWIMTDTWKTGELYFAAGPAASARWYFIEGETPAAHRIWDPAT
jgi:hypothetical protein